MDGLTVAGAARVEGGELNGFWALPDPAFPAPEVKGLAAVVTNGLGAAAPALNGALKGFGVLSAVAPGAASVGLAAFDSVAAAPPKPAKGFALATSFVASFAGDRTAVAAGKGFVVSGLVGVSF